MDLLIDLFIYLYTYFTKYVSKGEKIRARTPFTKPYVCIKVGAPCTLYGYVLYMKQKIESYQVSVL